MTDAILTEAAEAADTGAPIKISARRAATRDKLIAAAAEAIVEKGFQGTTLDEIAARAGMTKGAVYDNFKSKDELFFAVVQARPSRLPMPEKVSGSAKKRMRRMGRAVAADVEARLQIPLRAEFLLYTLSHPQMRERIDEWLKSGFATERARLLEVFEAGELPMSPDAFIVMMQALVPGLLYLRSQSPDLVTDDVVEEIFAALGKA
jgi:AcrR family transcriptional regulator